jgi:hypothetical protein
VNRRASRAALTINEGTRNVSNEKKIDFSKPVTPAAGTWPCIVMNGIAAEETDTRGKPTGRIRARVNVVLDGGPDKGKMTTYEDEVNAKSSLYISRSLKSVGWKGGSLSTVEADIEKWVKETGGKSTVEIRHIEIKKGKRFEEWCDAWHEQGNDGDPPPLYWAKANAVGRGPRPLAAPAVEALSDADEQMRRAMSEDGGSAPQDDVPHAGSDDIPFATCSTVSLGEIAKVLK